MVHKEAWSGVATTPLFRVGTQSKWCVCVSIRNNWVGNRTFPYALWLSEVYVCWFFDRSASDCVHYFSVDKIWRIALKLFWTCVFMVFGFWFSPNHTLIKYKCSAKKSYHMQAFMVGLECTLGSKTSSGQNRRLNYKLTRWNCELTEWNQQLEASKLSLLSLWWKWAQGLIWEPH